MLGMGVVGPPPLLQITRLERDMRYRVSLGGGVCQFNPTQAHNPTSCRTPRIVRVGFRTAADEKAPNGGGLLDGKCTTQ